VSARVVLIPNTMLSQGTGHLHRCSKAFAANPEHLALWTCLDPALLGTKELFSHDATSTFLNGLAAASTPAEGQYDVAVLDFQRTPPALLNWVKSRVSVVIGWDEGGVARSFFPFLVDSLPHESLPAPNVRLPGLLGYPEWEPSKTGGFLRPIRNVLVSFGGADAANLTVRFFRYWAKLERKNPSGLNLTYVQGPFARFELPGPLPTGSKLVKAPKNFSNLVAETDLLVTSWGLTMLEALSNEKPVILFNPSRYHEKLAVRAQMPTLGRFALLRSRWAAALKSAPAASDQAAKRFLSSPVSAASYFGGFSGTTARCPVCRTDGHKVFARTEHKSFFYCRSCSMEFLSVYQLPPKQYSDSYFFQDYQAQYGKTYLEDFQHIESLGIQRLKFLATLGQKPERVLDVGCAFGPFLSAASKAGIQPFGMDIAASAVNYVKLTLGFPAVQGSWLDFQWFKSFSSAAPDLLTMWYVIEHFPDVNQVLRKVSEVLAPGGVFAFGTPNGKGITRKFRGAKFWEESPEDHFSVWNRENALRILPRYGFEVLGFRNTGQHPDRFPGLALNRGWRYRLVSWWGSLRGWGDTFEVYAKKVRELP